VLCAGHQLAQICAAKWAPCALTWLPWPRPSPRRRRRRRLLPRRSSLLRWTTRAGYGQMHMVHIHLGCRCSPVLLWRRSLLLRIVCHLFAGKLSCRSSLPSIVGSSIWFSKACHTSTLVPVCLVKDLLLLTLLENLLPQQELHVTFSVDDCATLLNQFTHRPATENGWRRVWKVAEESSFEPMRVYTT